MVCSTNFLVCRKFFFECTVQTFGASLPPFGVSFCCLMALVLPSYGRSCAALWRVFCPFMLNIWSAKKAIFCSEKWKIQQKIPHQEAQPFCQQNRTAILYKSVLHFSRGVCVCVCVCKSLSMDSLLLSKSFTYFLTSSRFCKLWFSFQNVA